ncbi:3-oxoacyl-(acyl-carrier-protein) reductase [Coprinopsis cinerea okayama7|uniref:3-oxoacyl-(Acyl-carrier-protein) reductase n=1 Tax=Coprinopsis cinerea (strain Okayama-7 / 130 / ATCC MYA-4618 / FGSC 9003) TaxID=240176 RepID=A8N5Y6_COPC7|nr:3-oxoacyl-(acyl-carrier-protein) reductase [Coprinopsis cinerea okayama7\|eukprot:XP_001830281.1 3-oxoacyl-(acyl-carrier-protein) reductase [Coprinopsis cinerea okayama7\
MSGYDKVKSQQKSAEEHYQNTVARIQQIQSQFNDSPGSGKLKGKVAVVTGVGSLKGIGRAAAILFAREGATHLYLIDYDGTNLPNLKSTIESKYPQVKVTTIQADAANEAAISGVCELALKEAGRLDVFFANAGLASMDPLHDTTVETFMNIMRVNALSCFLAVKHASTAMMKTNSSRGKDKSGGSIILTASTAGIRSGAGTVDYSAAKAAVNSIAKTSAYQLQKTDIRVNTICPGLIETGMTGATFDYARKRGTAGKIGQLNPLGRYGVAEEIANAALFLASDDSSYVNGQNIAVDGGLSASHPVVPGRWA